jgi:hypothetical protein
LATLASVRPRAFPAKSKLKCWPTYAPYSNGLLADSALPLRVTEFPGFYAPSRPSRSAHQAPRAPLPCQGVTSPGVASSAPSEGVTPPSSLIRAHAPVPNPPVGSASAPPRGLCRLLPAPAGSGTFPTLSLHSLCRCLDPIPRGVIPVHSPVSSKDATASP